MGDAIRRIRRECSRRANAEYRDESDEELISYYNAHYDEIDTLCYERREGIIALGQA